MAPKAAKKGLAKKPNAPGAAVVNKNWEAGLTTAQFQEDSWQACVSLVVGRSPEEEEGLTKALSLAVQKPQRRGFSLLTWDSTLIKIHELGNPKAKRPDDIHAFYEVTEPAKVLLDAGEEIPPDLMAKILKFQLLQIKANDRQRREAERAEEEKTKSGLHAVGKDKAGDKVSDRKGKSQPSPGGPSTEKKTQLKRRDDIEPPKFIDDEPLDGPQHYILLLGFYQPHLMGALDAVGVHVANVIKLCSEHTRTSEGQQGQRSCGGNKQSQRASSVLDAGAEVGGGVELPAQAGKLDLFWSGLRPVLDSGPPDSKLHDVVLLSYTIPDVRPPFHTLEPEAELEMGSRIFEGVASVIYDCLDCRRHHQHYLDNIKLIRVPAVVGLGSQPAEVVPTPLPPTPRSKKRTGRVESPPDPEPEPPKPPLSTDVDMRFYLDLLDLVPPEACSVPLILHCMLEQVVISTEQTLPPPSCVLEEPQPHSSPGLDYQLVSFMLQSFLPLVHTREDRSHMLNSLLSVTQNEDDKKRLMEKFGAEETQKKSEHPLVIRHHNETALRLRDISAVQGFDPAEVELSMMRRSPVWRMIPPVAQQGNSDSCWMAIKQQLQHHCTDDVVSWPEVERLIHQSVFESMPLTRLDQKGVLLSPPGPPEPAIIPWDSPLSYAKQHLNNLRTKGLTFLTGDPVNTEETSGRIRCQLDVSDIQSCRLRSLFDWHYAEHHSASVFPQVLQLAWEEYRCLDTFRGSHNNTLYMFCHNPMSPYRQCKEFWDVALHTDVKFRRYLENVADTISDWTKEEDLKREAMQRRNPSPVNEEKAVDSSEEEEDTLLSVIRKGSLKAWKLEQEQLKEEEEVAKKSKKENTPKGKQQQQKEEKEAVSKDNKKSKKNGAETACSSAKTPTESITTSAEGNKGLHPPEEPFNGFTGYSMDGKLIHVSGRCQYLFPSDGGRVAVENVSYVEGSSLMKVAVKKDGHRFYTHINHVVVEPSKRLPQPRDKETTGRKEDFKVSEPVEMKKGKQGSFSGVLDNGIHLSYSFYGPTGEDKVSPQTSTFDPIPLSSSNHRSKGTNLDSESKVPHMEGGNKVCDGMPASCPFSSLNLSVPNGLMLQFLREDTQEEQGMLVKQGFPLHGRGVVGQIHDPSLSKELSRVVTSQGAVIRHMRDGSTEVLFANGSVSFSQDSGPVWVPDSEVEEENTSEETEGMNKEQSPENEAEPQRGCWLTTTPSGARIHTVGTTHKHIPTTPLLVFKATDPVTHEVMLSREDLVVSVRNPEGSLSVEHADGTRITTLYQERPPGTPQHLLLHTGEQPESVTVKSSCADSINENIQDTCDNEEMSGVSAGKACDGEDAGHACKELSGCESSLCRNGAESAFAGENGERSACGSGGGSVSNKERVVLVEKEGCATVVMYPERHTAHVFLADGTVITGDNKGAYQVFPSSAGLLQIQSDGECVYSSDPLVSPSPKGCTPTHQPGSYAMSHTDKVACDITDPDGNHFQVMEDGQVSVCISRAPSTLKQDEEEPEDEEDEEMARIDVKHTEHCPRLFLVHDDGSATELLNAQTVGEVLYQAYSDPTIALQKEPLQGDFGITILKPSHQSVWSQWLLGKQNPDITPPNLRNRSWRDFPRTEIKSPGPPFGADMGRGLTLREGSGGSAAQRRPVRSCPKVLEMRELYQHRPLTSPFRNTVDARLKEYMECLIEREQRSEEMNIRDPRTEGESVHARDLLNLVLTFAEEEDASHSSDKRTPVDIANLYSKGVGAPCEQSDVSEDAATAASDSFTNGKESNWTERSAQYRQELCEEQIHREALRKNNVIPYFHPENIPLYQNLLQHQTPHRRSLSVDLPPSPESDSPDASLKDAPQKITPRPSNPTPYHSASHAGRSDRMLEKRSTNPTPQTAGESSLRGSSGRCESLLVDVTGKLRRTKVRLPTSILGSKPRSVPNPQFLSVEEPVRRKSRTVSLTDPSLIARGFQMLPSSVDFGTLKEGTSSAVIVVMKNVGVDTCRFHVKQPPRATGLRVIYNPGPVAAGLHVELQVQLFAVCAVQAGEVEPKKHISQDVVIHTETDILYLPVTATFLPERLYDVWLQEHSSKRNKRGSRVRQLASRLPVGQEGRTAPERTRPLSKPTTS